MKRIIVLIVALTAASGALFSQDKSFITLAGDVDGQTIMNAQNEASVYPGPFTEVTAGALVDGKLTFSRQYTTLGLLDFTFQDANVLNHLNAAKIENLSFLVNELYSDLSFGDLLYLRLGKQRLKWGAGFVFNPSDPVNPPKDPTAMRAVREGVTAAKLELITKSISLMSFGVLYDAVGQTGVGSKVSTSVIPGTDVSLSGYWSRSESWTGALNASVAPFYDVPGWDTIQLWFEGSLYGKGRYASFAQGINPGAVDLGTAEGIQYNFLFGASAQVPEILTTVLVEYYHLSEGLSRGELGTVYQALRSPNLLVLDESQGWYAELARRPGRQSPDYLFVSLSQPTVTDNGDPIFDKIGLTATCLLSLPD
ncbi:MAG TPA: hypothetical protein VFB30_19855, partial [Spirochaetia bacterium]|nr:hypothetical protein [Spirochaetia bacterium]